MALPIYRDEAVVTLTAINHFPSMPFPNRKLFLSRSNSTIPIGRTSKRNTHYEALEKNCWIDSSVVSRDHAELCLDPQQQSIVLRDIGSLHGTFVNTKRLRRNQNHVLQSGDILQFGVPIERGHEIYDACNFEAHVEFGLRNPAKRPMVFAVPDETDIDEMSGNDDLDDEEKDSGVVHSSQILRNNSIIPALSDAREQHHDDQNVIDLTANDKIIQQGDKHFDQRSSSDLEHYIIRSDLSETRMPTPPETLERYEEDLMFTESDIGEDDESDASQEDDLFHDNESQAASGDESLNGDLMLSTSMIMPLRLETAVDKPCDEASPSNTNPKNAIGPQPQDDMPVDLLGIERDAPDGSVSNHVDEMVEDVHTFFQACDISSGSPLDDSSAYQWEMSKRAEAKKAELSNLHHGLVENSLKSAFEPQNRLNKRKAEEISQEENINEWTKSVSNEAQSDVPSPKRFRAFGEKIGYTALGTAIGVVTTVGALIVTAPSF